MPEGWTPTDTIALGRLGFDLLQFLGTAILIVIVLFMNKNLNGRMGQIIDIIGRLSGAPDRRVQDEPVTAERRSKDK